MHGALSSYKGAGYKSNHTSKHVVHKAKIKYYHVSAITWESRERGEDDYIFLSSTD